jgi:hypothetical protein
MSTTPTPRQRAIRIEVGADVRSYVSGSQRVTLEPLSIKRRQSRHLNLHVLARSLGTAAA